MHADYSILCCCVGRAVSKVPFQILSGLDGHVLLCAILSAQLYTLCSFIHISACVQSTTAGQLRNRKSGSSRGAKETEPGESITFADVAGVDEAKEELEEIVVSKKLLTY